MGLYDRAAQFYSAGISSDVHSPRFQKTFEDVYSEPELEGIPWYVVAGNHDHKGNVQAQIDYSAKSERWNFPDFYYTWTSSFKAPSGRSVSTQIIYLDSVTLAGMSYKDEASGEIVSGEAHPMQAQAGSQLTWLEDQLRASSAEYLWVSAHYPIYSQCEHGPTSDLIKHVLPLMRQYNATGFIAGHDHCLGHYEGTGEDAGMHFVVSGAGKECCYSPKHLSDSQNKGHLAFRMDKEQSHGASGGFASVSATEHSASVTYYDTKGTSLYTSKSIAPRR